MPWYKGRRHLGYPPNGQADVSRHCLSYLPMLGQSSAARATEQRKLRLMVVESVIVIDRGETYTSLMLRVRTGAGEVILESKTVSWPPFLPILNLLENGHNEETEE